jgi:D-beta-D-heptose 7-phosphate kinase/D-beta-D-heptose 1-phosphate adenosyltransferase
MKKILVIGESCKDVFVYCHAQRLAPDLPIPILDVLEETENPGMAANVARNVKAIHDACDLYTNEGWEQVTKTRYVHRKTNHAFIRIDSKHPVPRAQVSKIPLTEYDIVGISDYDKGFLLEEDIRDICDAHPNVFIDTKKMLGPWVSAARFIKINNFEFERSKASLTPELIQKIIRTEGGNGAHYNNVHYPVFSEVQVQDSSGAGDSFFAALLVQFAETGIIEEAIEFANECACRVVGERGVGVIRRPW